MTKHQWLQRVILVAGTIVLAACTGPASECQYSDETGDAFCNTRSITDPSSAPATTVVDPDQN